MKTCLGIKGIIRISWINAFSDGTPRVSSLLIPTSPSDVQLVLDMPLFKGEHFGTKKGMRQKQEAFLRYWYEEGCRQLDMQCYLSDVSLAAADPLIRDSLNQDQLVLNHTIKPLSCVYAIWTIGHRPEEAVQDFFVSNQGLQAVFLDVAETKVLLRMHGRIQRWIRENIAGLKSLNIVQEYYPGNNLAGNLDLVEFAKRTAAGQTVRLVDGLGMFSPRKTMYSVFILGDGPERVLEPIRACPYCSGLNCLYRQLGGCHRLDTVNSLEK
jgi:hypothetical protein